MVRWMMLMRRHAPYKDTMSYTVLKHARIGWKRREEEWEERHTKQWTNKLIVSIYIYCAHLVPSGASKPVPTSWGPQGILCHWPYQDKVQESTTELWQCNAYSFTAIYIKRRRRWLGPTRVLLVMIDKCPYSVQRAAKNLTMLLPRHTDY